METILTDYSSYVVNGDWAPALNKAILEIRQFHNNSVPITGTEGGIIKIPKGRYSIKSTINLYNGITFSGEGMGSLFSMEDIGSFKRNTEFSNVKYVRFEKLYFQRGANYDFSTTKCFIDFTLCYLCTIDSCLAVGSGNVVGGINFTILGDTLQADDFGHFNTLSNCDILDFNNPFIINYNRQMGINMATELTNDHRIIFNRFRNFGIQLVPINLYSGHNKFCFNAIETESVSEPTLMIVPGTANVIIGNRVEKHNPRIMYGAQLIGSENVFIGNHFVGVGTRDSNGQVHGGSVTMSGTNNILLEPGAPGDPNNVNDINIGSAYFLESLSLGQQSNFNFNVPTGGISILNPESWQGNLQPTRRIKAYDQNGTFVGYIPIFS
jgi:hypothetical protein